MEFKRTTIKDWMAVPISCGLALTFTTAAFPVGDRGDPAIFPRTFRVAQADQPVEPTPDGGPYSYIQTMSGSTNATVAMEDAGGSADNWWAPSYSRA